jgi:hypothetical protein
MAKRLAAAAVVTALAASLLASLAGCGAGAEQAQDLMKAADGTMMANWKAVGEVSSRADDLNAWLSGALAAGSGIDQGGFDEAVEELRTGGSSRCKTGAAGGWSVERSREYADTQG